MANYIQPGDGDVSGQDKNKEEQKKLRGASTIDSGAMGAGGEDASESEKSSDSEEGKISEFRTFLVAVVWPLQNLLIDY